MASEPILDNRPMGHKQAAEFLNMSGWTLYHKVASGEIAVHRPGRKLVFFKSDLIAYITQNRSPAGFELAQEAQRRMTARA